MPVRAERSRGYGVRRSVRIRPRRVRCAGTINLNCSQRHSAISLLGAEGTQYTPRHYLKAPPPVLEIDDVPRRRGLEPWDLARVGEPVALELGLARWPREETDRIRWIEALAAHPIFDPTATHHPGRRDRGGGPLTGFGPGLFCHRRLHRPAHPPTGCGAARYLRGDHRGQRGPDPGRGPGPRGVWRPGHHAGGCTDDHRFRRQLSECSTPRQGGEAMLASP